MRSFVWFVGMRTLGYWHPCVWGGVNVDQALQEAAVHSFSLPSRLAFTPFFHLLPVART